MRGERGFILVTTLVIFLVLFILGAAAMYISEVGFRIHRAETRWQALEKASNSGLMKYASDVIKGTIRCGDSRTYSVNGVNVEVRAVSAGGSCFVWSKATMGDAKVVKVANFNATSNTNYAAIVIRSLSNLVVDGSSSINSCDLDCRVPAVVIGNDIPDNYVENLVVNCPRNPKGINALVDPVVENAPMPPSLVERIFNGINNRNDLLNLLSQRFSVTFNNGTPGGLSGVPASCSFNYNNCTASGNTITCGKETITWNGTAYMVGTSVCPKIDLGPNATLTFSGVSFTGGGAIAANQITFSQRSGTSGDGELVLVARNQITMSSNNISISKPTHMFAQNYDISGNGLNVNATSVIYSGGAGVGNLNINLSSNSQLGTTENPVLIISDNNINLSRNGTAEINGVIFTTEANNNFSISGNGNFTIRGMIVSDSNRNNNLNISGNLSIWFDKGVIQKLNNKLGGLVKNPTCGVVSVKVPYINTKMTVY
mgnify:CR=1 FL=1